MSDFAKRLDAARFAVAEACYVCRKVQSQLESVRSMLKDDRSPVTIADFASQAVVARALGERLGQVTLVAEEDADELRAQIKAGNAGYAEAILESVKSVWPNATLDEVLEAIDIGGAEPPHDDFHGFWTLDPIDGTKGFLRGGQYAVSLAWIEAGSPVIGAVGCPNLSADFARPFDDPDPHGCLYMGVAGEGVYEVPADDVDAPHQVKITRLESAEDEPVRMCESVESGHTSHDASERVIERIGEPAEPARLDSQAKYCVVARGQADLYLRLPRPPKPGKAPYVERIWDHAAGSLVAREAGCAVTDAFGRSLDFSHGKGLEKNKGIVVAPPRLHGRAIAAIEESGALEGV